MKNKSILTLIFFAVISVSSAQDSLAKKSSFLKNRCEIGVSVLTPFIMIAGAEDQAERFTNITARYFVAPRHALKILGGGVIGSNNYSMTQQRYLGSNQSYTLTTQSITSANFNVGLGYEYVMGHRKLKHVLGFDLIYNNKSVNDESYYETTTAVPGTSTPVVHKLDTGSYSRRTVYNKGGFNISYSLRYEISRRWVITASTIYSNRVYRTGSGNQRSTVFDLSLNGLVSDVSVFFRF